MKLMAARDETDTADIKTLYRLCGFTTVREGLELVERAYSSDRILPKTEYLLTEIVESLHAESGSG